MISALLISAAFATAPVPAAGAPADILAGAERAIDAGRLDQAAGMISRAVLAGASAREATRAIADLEFASGKNAEALAHYRALLGYGAADTRLFERAGIAALKLGDADAALALLIRATSSDAASWRAWNALGVAYDLRRDWMNANMAFKHAELAAPDEAAPWNNHGWSLLLRGQWAQALGYFQHAHALDPNSERVANNLELTSAAMAADLPSRRAGEADSSWAERLNDAGVAALLVGDKTRAVAAFAQALDASDTWYLRAANNFQAADK